MGETGLGPGLPGLGREGSGPEVVVVGNLTIDDVVHANGETTMASPGGNTLHAAAGARIWGVSVGVVARVGADFPAAALDRLRDAGIDTLGLHRIPGPTVRNWVVYEQDGRRSWVYRTPPERSLEVAPCPEDLPAEWAARDGRTPVVHVAAMPFQSAARVVDHVRAHGPAVVTLDTHEAWTVGRAELLALAGRQVDVFLPSREELVAIVGYDDPDKACRELLDEGVPAVVVKCGTEGAVLGTANGPVLRIAAPEVDAVDVTGAGDSFCGGLAAGLALGEDLEDAAQRGAATGGGRNWGQRLVADSYVAKPWPSGCAHRTSGARRRGRRRSRSPLKPTTAT